MCSSRHSVPESHQFMSVNHATNSTAHHTLPCCTCSRWRQPWSCSGFISRSSIRITRLLRKAPPICPAPCSPTLLRYLARPRNQVLRYAHISAAHKDSCVRLGWARSIDAIPTAPASAISFSRKCSTVNHLLIYASSTEEQTPIRCTSITCS